MTSPAHGAPVHDPLAVFRQPNFTLFAVGRFTSATGQRLMDAAIAWQVFQISGNALDLGLIGLVRFAPSLGLGLVGGAVADRYDRKRILLLTQLAPLIGAIVLFTATRAGSVNLPLIYGVVLLSAIAGAFEQPARQSLLPSLVAKETFPQALTVTSTVQSLAFVTGPALGGFAIAVISISGAYAIQLGLIAVSLGAVLFLHPAPIVGPRRAVSIGAIKEGIQFVFHRQALLGAMTLDMFAVVFGGATALLPIYATEILKVGSAGYGILSGSLEAGALVMAAILIFAPPIRNTGRTLILAVAAFGVATIIFGFSRSFPLSLVAYMLVGMADEVSVVMRQTTIQLSTPDELRGRVTSVNFLFIGASNQVGAMESGFVAAATSATFAVVSGGIGCLAVVGAVWAKMPELRRYRVGAPIRSLETAASPSLVLEGVELAGQPEDSTSAV